MTIGSISRGRTGASAIRTGGVSRTELALGALRLRTTHSQGDDPSDEDQNGFLEAEILDPLDALERMTAAGSEPVIASKGLP